MSHIRIYNKLNLKLKKQSLRNKATVAEKILWSRIRTNKLGVRFHRQFGVGPCILDFYCPSQKLAIELDGEQHKLSKEYDKFRTEYLSAFGIIVLRFWNDEVENNIEKVLQKIVNHLRTSPSSPSLIKEGDTPEGERKF
jgi:very-short-patch-repair endonuclease